MSLVIHYEKGRLIKAEQKYIRTVPSPIYAAKDGKTFVMGEVFDASYEDIANSNWKEDANVLSEFRGAFSIAYADKSNCAFCTDRKGIEPWYYYHSEEDFIVSDSFWDIIQIIQPNYSMMNTSRVRESLLCPSVTGETPINGLNYLLPAYFVKYDSKDHSLQVEKYWDFKYSNEVTDVNDAVENMDRLFDETMASIKSKVGNCSFGMGISGGLDSRVVAHYAKKNQLNIIGFNVCVPKPNGVFKAKSIENARKIAQIFEIPYCDIAWDPKNIEGKIAEKIKRYPLGTGRNTFKYENNLPHFDVLLTGGSGELVGDYLPDGIENMTEEEFISVMKKCFYLCRRFPLSPPELRAP